MDKRLARANAALQARKTSFPVLVLDGNASIDPVAFRATLYDAARQPIGEPMTQEQVKAGQHFLHRMATRAEWEKEGGA